MLSKQLRRISILTDLHLRDDLVYGYMDEQVNTLLRLVNKKPTDVVVINGDLFQKRNPKGSELLALKRLLKGFKCKKVYINRGNHDTLSKDGTLDTTLSLFESEKVHVIVDDEVIDIYGQPFHFIPHYEDESIIISKIGKTDYPIFGHFGFDGSLSHNNYAYSSYVKKSHFGDRITFLGHIHHCKQYGSNVFMLGTQYSTSFGEANSTKYFHEIIMKGDLMEVIRTPIEFGIKHIVGTVDEIEKLNSKFKFNDFFTLLKVKVDNVDLYAKDAIKDDILSKYNLGSLEIVFEDTLPMNHNSVIRTGSIVSLTDDIVEDYIDKSNSNFSKEDILEALDTIRKYK